jgi:hypothetical protein
MSYPTFEPEDTKQFTWVASQQPDAHPSLAFYGLDDTTLLASLTSQQSDTTHYWTLFTFPATEGYYRGEWRARKTAIGSAYNLVTPFVVQVRKTRTPG